MNFTTNSNSTPARFSPLRRVPQLADAASRDPPQPRERAGPIRTRKPLLDAVKPEVLDAVKPKVLDQ